MEVTYARHSHASCFFNIEDLTLYRRLFETGHLARRAVPVLIEQEPSAGLSLDEKLRNLLANPMPFYCSSDIDTAQLNRTVVEVG